MNTILEPVTGQEIKNVKIVNEKGIELNFGKMEEGDVQVVNGEIQMTDKFFRRIMGARGTKFNGGGKEPFQIPCPHGCGQNFGAAKLREHKPKCALNPNNRLEACGFCGQSFPRSELRKSHLRECKKNPTSANYEKRVPLTENAVAVHSSATRWA